MVNLPARRYCENIASAIDLVNGANLQNGDARCVSSGFLDHTPTHMVGEGIDRFFQIAVECDPVPSPSVPHGKQFFHISHRLDAKLGSARPVIRIIVDRFSPVEENFLLVRQYFRDQQLEI